MSGTYFIEHRPKRASFLLIGSRFSFAGKTSEDIPGATVATVGTGCVYFICRQLGHPLAKEPLLQIDTPRQADAFVEGLKA